MIYYQLIFYEETPYEPWTSSRGRIFAKEKSAYKCAYEYYCTRFCEGSVVFVGAEEYETLLSATEFANALAECGQVLISQEDGTHIYISYAESELEQ